ncbi:MAG: SMI1/KNR4 family protein [Halothece sp.]
MFNWRSLLTELSSQIIREEEDLPSAMVEAQWLGYSGATEEQLLKAESRLGIKLPHSYREFLKVSNGFGMWNDPDPCFHLLPIEAVDWLVSTYPTAPEDWDDFDVSDEDYFVYGWEQDCVEFRAQYLKTSLQISNEYIDTAIALLNPEISLQEGEWEAWCLDSKLPGANRYQTFWDFMQQEPFYS